MLELSAGIKDEKATRSLQAIKKLKGRHAGDLSGAVISAGYYAKKLGKTMYVYSGNSYGWAIWRVSYKKSEYLCAIGNTGNTVYSVTPNLDVLLHNVFR